jgi:hypothetical protein
MLHAAELKNYHCNKAEYFETKILRTLTLAYLDSLYKVILRGLPLNINHKPLKKFVCYTSNYENFGTLKNRTEER